ncbi:MAG: hypothetical protein HN760_03435, partial [Microbacteriaceae bacterium]|nr:hypothetical protein [Microbacteriaceae bacterium]
MAPINARATMSAPASNTHAHQRTGGKPTKPTQLTHRTRGQRDNNGEDQGLDNNGKKGNPEDQRHIGTTGLIVSALSQSLPPPREESLGTITVGSEPYGVAVSPDGTKAYVVNRLSNNVSV